MATEPDKVDVGTVATVGVVGAIITYALVTIAQVVHHRLEENEIARKNMKPPAQLSAYLTEQQEELDSYRWVDESSKKVGIPVSVAMKKVTANGGKLPDSVTAAPEPPEDATPAELGEGLYTTLGCNACHSLDGSKVVGPTFKGIWGEQHEFGDGSKAKVNAAYVKESILYPQKKVLAGYPPVMPAFEGRVSDEDLANLVAFIKAQGD